MVKRLDAQAKRSASSGANKAELALRERIKELTCLYRISQISDRNAATSDNVFQDIVEAIPPAWQYPEAATARIEIDGKSFRSSDFKEGRRKMAAPIFSGGKRRGVVEVVYARHRQDDGAMRFLKEEHNLIRAIARQIGFIIEHRQAEKEKAELQSQLIHADRLATIGQLAAGVAHELNEPLGNILGFAQLVRKYSGLSEKPAHDIDKIVDASLYAREIIKKLLLFARQAPPCKTRVTFNNIISEALGLFEHRFEKDGIEMVRDFSPRLPPIIADAGQLKQVIVNLVTNAIQAMPEGGALTVRTADDETHLVCTVEDTGTGMSQEVLDRIFVPFFTTKDIDQGTGLGLPVVYGIVTSHGGTIMVKSSPGKGTTFIIRLPVDASPELVLES